MIRPNEGDLIYFPFTKGIFEIKFVEHEATFYQTGSLQFYELRCEKFNYSGETIDVGIEDIDNVEKTYSTASDNFYILTEDGFYLTDADGNPLVLAEFDEDNLLIGSENEFFQLTANSFIDFSVTDPFSEGGHV